MRACYVYVCGEAGAGGVPLQRPPGVVYVWHWWWTTLVLHQASIHAVNPGCGGHAFFFPTLEVARKKNIHSSLGGVRQRAPDIVHRSWRPVRSGGTRPKLNFLLAKTRISVCVAALKVLSTQQPSLFTHT